MYQRQYMVRFAERHAAAGDIPHGTANGAKNYRCRCDVCSTAARERDARRYKAAKQERSGLAP